jgi:hypothetical protein
MVGPVVGFLSIRALDALFAGLVGRFCRHGWCLVRHTPITREAVIDLANRIAAVQPTIYGHSFDVKVRMPAFRLPVNSRFLHPSTFMMFQDTKDPINIAYSNASLDLHMDLAYYESPPGLQLLHCLRFDDDVQGGLSQLLDGFRVAEVTLASLHDSAFSSPTVSLNSVSVFDPAYSHNQPWHV